MIWPFLSPTLSSGSARLPSASVANFRHLSARSANLSRSSAVAALFESVAHTRAISRNFFGSLVMISPRRTRPRGVIGVGASLSDKAGSGAQRRNSRLRHPSPPYLSLTSRWIDRFPASASAGTLFLPGGASPPYIGANISAKLRSMPRITTFVLLLGVGLNLLSCTKKIDGNTSFREATKGFQKELTKDQRKSAIEQLQTETAGKP